MRTFIFGIGGTGARVMRSLSMLMASGAYGTGTEDLVVPVIIDYDLDNDATKKVREILKEYEKINKITYTSDLSEVIVKQQFFSSPIMKLKDFHDGVAIDDKADYQLYLKEEDTKKSYAYHIGFKKLSEGAHLKETQDLLRILYDDSDENDPCAELNLKLDKGFKGCPNIGCVVTKSLTESRELKKFISIINNNDRIVIIGSIFGGTGASGIPMLLDLVKDSRKTREVPVAVIAVTPYFKVDKDTTSAIDSDTFTAKARAALDAYDLGESVNQQATYIYYVGDNYKKGTFTNNEGGSSQKNPAHVVEFIAATMVLDFMAVDFNDPQNRLYVRIKQKARPFEMGLRELSDENGVDDKLQLHRFFPVTQERYIYPLARFIIFAKFFETYVYSYSERERDTGLINSGITNYKDFKDSLHKFIGYFYEWIKEIQNDSCKRALLLFHDPKTATYDNLFTDIKTSSKDWNSFRTNHFINQKKHILDPLNKFWNERQTQPGLKEPARYFIDAMDEITKNIFKNILKKQK